MLIVCADRHGDQAGLSLPGVFGAGGGEEIVVADEGLHFDQEVGVEVVAGAKSSPPK
jgi:hypothetical protein